MDKNTTAVIKLDFPIEFDGQTIDTLTMRRPKGRDNLIASKVKGNDLERGLTLFANLCDQPMEVLLELDEADIDKLGAQHEAFTGRQSGTPTS